MNPPISIRFFNRLRRLYPRAFRQGVGAASVVWRTRPRSWMGPAGILACRVARAIGQATRPVSMGRLASDALLDLRFTLRSLRKSPTFSLLVILIAGMGISVSILAFTIVNAAFLRPLPFVRAPGDLLRISRQLPSGPDRLYRLSYQDVEYLQERSSTLHDVVGVRTYLDLMVRFGGGLDRKVIGGEITDNYFQGLGIPMAIGRGIAPGDDGTGGRVAVLGYATWLRDFGGTTDVLGQTVVVDGARHTIVGVAPKGLGSLTGEPIEYAVWIPLREEFRDTRDRNVLEVAARLRGDATPDQAQAELDALAAALVTMDPERWTGDAGDVGLRAMTDREARLYLIGGPRGVASILIYVVFIGLIMMITCFNVASLLLDRALRRRPEIAMRLALGAARGRLVRQLLMESVLLFFFAGLAALLLLNVGTQLLAAGWFTAYPVVADIRVDLWVAAFAFAVTLACGVVFGLLPALQATGPDLVSGVRRGGGRSASSLRPKRWLVASQVAASMVLVAVSALLVSDVKRAESLDLGFGPEGIAVASLNLGFADFSTAEAQAWLERLGDRIEALPGVEAVATAIWVPLAGSRWGNSVQPEGVDVTPERPLSAAFNAVTPGYFDLVRMPLAAGREFTDGDTRDATLVAIVNEAFARRYWPDQQPLGKSIRLGAGPEEPPLEVVGVVRDALYTVSDMRRGTGEPHVWVPRAQSWHDVVQIHARVTGPVGPVLGAIRAEIRLMDEDLPIVELATMEELADRALLEPRISAIVFGGLSGLALILAALGIYGVMAQAVTERTREMGVRLAVGAHPANVVQMVLADSLKVSTVGIAVGLGLSVLVALGLRAIFVGTESVDPVALSGSVAVLILAALLAGVVPAGRAATVDPVVSLKSE